MTAKSKLLLALILAFTLTVPDAGAVERGSAGLIETPFVARNTATREISCSVSLAHWYSAELGRAAPGARIAVSFWRDPASGALYLLNEAGDRMAVQMTWCGFAGNSWESRSVVTLAQGKAADLTCVSATDRLVCR
ncbi:hypothetical protein G5V57_22470 [Nordella sp. HKS 07]|uniref:hypothetical protein n=1 Tax=Nordella sp. HKS 07 TaxID=2712222 RepID=UPI0013E0FA5D|nr:hypothetical protein [Nordella sp. HKS 07]QIG50245.1 hypothetical protein G5V57_22470 [Nordella sp. HKS 07]